MTRYVKIIKIGYVIQEESPNDRDDRSDRSISTSLAGTDTKINNLLLLTRYFSFGLCYTENVKKDFVLEGERGKRN